MFAKVVIGLDGTAASRHATEQIAPLVKAFDGELVMVFVRHIPVMAEPATDETFGVVEETLEDLAEQTRGDAEELLGSLGVRWSYLVKDGDPTTEILAVAHEQGATLVAVGATVHGGITSILVSSVADHLLHHSDLPLLVVRPETPRG